jgi:hypothetical protein
MEAILAAGVDLAEEPGGAVVDRGRDHNTYPLPTLAPSTSAVRVPPSLNRRTGTAAGVQFIRPRPITPHSLSFTSVSPARAAAAPSTSAPSTLAPTNTR